MTDARTALVLQDVVRRESRSLLQYISEAFPWTTPEERAALAQLQQLIAEEQRAATDLGRFLVRRRITPPHLGAYPMVYANINYVALDHLLPLLVANQRQAIARLEQDLATLTDVEAKAQVQKILAMKRRHQGALEGLAAGHPERIASQPAAAATLT